MLYPVVLQGYIFAANQATPAQNKEMDWGCTSSSAERNALVAYRLLPTLCILDPFLPVRMRETSRIRCIAYYHL